MIRVRPRRLVDNNYYYNSLPGNVQFSLGSRLDATYNFLGEETITGGLLISQRDRQAFRDQFTPEQNDVIDAQLSAIDNERNNLIQQISFNENGSAVDPSITRRLVELNQLRNQVYDSAINEQLSIGVLIPPEQLNEQYAEYGYNFQEPMSQTRVDMIIDRQRERRIRETIRNLGPQGVLPSVLGFTATLAQFVTDPLTL